MEGKKINGHHGDRLLPHGIVGNASSPRDAETTDYENTIKNHFAAIRSQGHFPKWLMFC